MSVFRTAMVWLGLVDDDEYNGEDEQYYLDNEYDEGGAEVAPAPAKENLPTTPLPAPAVPQTPPPAVPQTPPSAPVPYRELSLPEQRNVPQASSPTRAVQRTHKEQPIRKQQDTARDVTVPVVVSPLATGQLTTLPRALTPPPSKPLSPQAKYPSRRQFRAQSSESRSAAAVGA